MFLQGIIVIRDVAMQNGTLRESIDKRVGMRKTVHYNYKNEKEKLNIFFSYGYLFKLPLLRSFPAKNQDKQYFSKARVQICILVIIPSKNSEHEDMAK